MQNTVKLLELANDLKRVIYDMRLECHDASLVAYLDNLERDYVWLMNGIRLLEEGRSL